MDSISRLRDNAFLVRRTQTARPFRVFWLDRFVRCEKKKILGFMMSLTKNNVFFLFFFARIGRSDLTKKLEKVGPFECDELEKHCRVSAKCYPTTVPGLYTMTKEKFNSLFLVLLLGSLQSRSQLLVVI